MGQAQDEARRRARISAHIVATANACDRSAHQRKAAWLWLAAAVSLGGWLLLWLQNVERSPLTLTGDGLVSPATSQVLVAGQSVAAAASNIASAQLSPIEVRSKMELLSGDVVAPVLDSTAQTWTARELSRVRFDGRTEVELAPDTRVRVVSDPANPTADELEVLRGQVRVLADQGPVRIRTKSVRIDGIGARFSVSFLSDDTRVHVDSGTVQVHRTGGSEKLRAGESWRHGSKDAESRAATTGDHGAEDNDTSAAPDPPSEQDSLGDQNRMFEAALLAKRRGLDSLALRQLEQLLGSYPRGALSEQARVERFRILHRTGNVEGARSAARAYLSAYPAGFARAEAESILGTEP
jgi:hypothetical protein